MKAYFLGTIRLKRFRLAALLPLSWLLARLGAAFPQWVEQYYARGLYPLLTSTLGRIFSTVPFSIIQLLLTAFVLYILYCTVRLVRRLLKGTGHRTEILAKATASVFCAAGCAAFFFTVTCGLLYYRLSFAEQVGLDVHPSSAEELAEMTRALVHSTNAARELVEEDAQGVMAFGQPSAYALASRAQEIYGNVATLYPHLEGYVARPKPFLFSQGMSLLDLGGIYIPFTFEPNINIHMPDYNIPSTMMHEMSHFKGYMREEEANFLAYLACRESGDPDFMYSGNMLALRHSLNALYRADRELYWEVAELLSPEVRLDMAANSAYWQQFEGPAAAVSSAVNDAYLKANSQASGVKSYGEMVDLLLAQWRRDNELA